MDGKRNADRTQLERAGAAQADAVSGVGRTQRDEGVDENSPYGAGTGSLPHTQRTNIPNRCSATNRFGQPCKARAIERGLCAMHSGKTNAKEMGAKGGSNTETALRKEVRADDELRESARQVLADALSGKKDIPKSALDAARSLFSYRSDAPPSPSSQGSAHPHAVTPKGRPTSIADVLIFAVENPGTRDWIEPLIDRLAARLAELRAEGNGSKAA